MNGTTKQRYISTSIWDDDWFDSLSEREKLAYFYLLTNPHTNAAGVYQCTLKNMRLEMGLEREEVERIMGKFAAAGKAFYLKDYIIIPKWLKHQKVGERSTMMLGAEKVLKSLPEDIKIFISDRKHYDWDISKIIGIDNQSSIDSLSLNSDSLSNKGNSLLEKGENSGIANPENVPENAHDSDLDFNSEFNSDSKFDIDIDLDGDLDSNTRREQPVEKPKTTTIVLHNLIKEKVKQHGYYIDDPVVKKIMKAIADPDWFTCKYNIIAFAAEKIDEVYSDKPKEERKKLFVSAITKWDNIKDEYPDWFNKKLKADELRALDKLRNTPPKICPGCNADIEGLRKCPKCKGYIVFSKDKNEWIFTEYISLKDAYKNRIQNNEPDF